MCVCQQNEEKPKAANLRLYGWRIGVRKRTLSAEQRTPINIPSEFPATLPFITQKMCLYSIYFTFFFPCRYYTLYCCHSQYIPKCSLQQQLTRPSSSIISVIIIISCLLIQVRLLRHIFFNYYIVLLNCIITESDNLTIKELT